MYLVHCWSGLGLLRLRLLDAYRFAGGPVPVRGLVVWRGTARFRVVRLGGPKIRKALCAVADARDQVKGLFYRTFA